MNAASCSCSRSPPRLARRYFGVQGNELYPQVSAPRLAAYGVQCTVCRVESNTYFNGCVDAVTLYFHPKTISWNFRPHRRVSCVFPSLECIPRMEMLRCLDAIIPVSFQHVDRVRCNVMRLCYSCPVTNPGDVDVASSRNFDMSITPLSYFQAYLPPPPHGRVKSEG